MSIFEPYLARWLAEERAKDLIHKAAQHRLAQMAKKARQGQVQGPQLIRSRLLSEFDARRSQCYNQIEVVET